MLFLGLLFLCLGIAVNAEADFYEVLGVEQDSTDKQIKRAFRKLSMKYHPDKNPGNEEAANKFLEINKAFEVLSDEDKRMVYDMDGHEGLEQMKKGGQRGNDPFSMMFGGGGGGGRQRGPDFKTYYDVTLNDLYNGAEKSLQINRNVICKGCRGSGAKDGKTKTCNACKGRGQVTKLQRLGPGFNVQMQQPCDKCGGKGKMPLRSCPKCGGQKVVKDNKVLDILIEKGMPDGHQMTFKRAGEQSPTTTPGDVVLVFRTAKHHLFTREGNNLRMTMQITLKEALLGFSKKFTHLDGRQVEVRNNIPVTYPDYVMKLKKEGMPHHEVSSEKGDLFITFKIKFPDKLTADQKAVIESIF